MVAQAFAFDGAVTITSRVTFPLYYMLTDMFGGTPLKIEPRPDWGFDLEAIEGSISPKTRMLWLCSPNNPTGHALTNDEIEALLDRLPEHVIAVLDESYSEFVTIPDPVDSVGMVQDGRPVIVVRSFSKFAGLANLRVGYGVASRQIIEYLLHARLPFNTGGIAMRAAAASLGDEAYRQAIRKLVIEEREFLRAGILQRGLECLPSQANFIMVPNVPGGGQSFSNSLLQGGLIVRPMELFGAPDAIRVTIGRRKENVKLLEALEQLMPAVAGAVQDQVVK
jgi:histidinol-phosphate aminotransferase